MRTWVLGIPQYVTIDPVQRRDQDTGLKIENPCPKFRIHLGLFFVTARKKVDLMEQKNRTSINKPFFWEIVVQGFVLASLC